MYSSLIREYSLNYLTDNTVNFTYVLLVNKELLDFGIWMWAVTSVKFASSNGHGNRNVFLLSHSELILIPWSFLTVHTPLIRVSFEVNKYYLTTGSGYVIRSIYGPLNRKIHLRFYEKILFIQNFWNNINIWVLQIRA